MCLSKYRILSRGDSRKRTSVGSETNTGCVKILDSDAWFFSKEQQEGQVMQAENQEGVWLQLEILLLACHLVIISPHLASCTYTLRTNVNILGSNPNLVQQQTDRPLVTFTIFGLLPATRFLH